MPDLGYVVAALVIAGAILVVLVQAVRGVGERLLDGVDPALLDQSRSAAASVAGVQGVGEVRARWIGHRLQAAETAPDHADAGGASHARSIAPRRGYAWPPSLRRPALIPEPKNCRPTPCSCSSATAPIPTCSSAPASS